MARFVGGHGDDAIQGKDAGLSIGFSAMLDTIHDDLPGRIVDRIEDAIVPDSEAMAFVS